MIIILHSANSPITSAYPSFKLRNISKSHFALVLTKGTEIQVLRLFNVQRNRQKYKFLL